MDNEGQKAPEVEAHNDKKVESVGVVEAKADNGQPTEVKPADVVAQTDEAKPTEIKPEEKKPEEKKKADKKVLYIFLGVLGSIILIVMGYLIFDNLFGPKAVHRNDVSAFLKERYDKDFDVKFVNKRHAAIMEEESIGCDGSTGSYSYKTGTDSNVMEYVYSFSSPDDPDIVSYVVYAQNTKDGTSRIYESSSKSDPIFACGGRENGEDSLYGNAVNSSHMQAEVLAALKHYEEKGFELSASGNSYITMRKRIAIELAAVDVEGFRAMLTEVVEVLQDKDTKVNIEYVNPLDDDKVTRMQITAETDPEFFVKKYCIVDEEPLDFEDDDETGESGEAATDSNTNIDE